MSSGSVGHRHKMTKPNGEGMMLPTKYANRREKILEQENSLVSFVCSVGGSVFLPVDEPASPMPATGLSVLSAACRAVVRRLPDEGG